MAKGFPGVPGNMQGLMKQAQKMQQDLMKAQQEAEAFLCEGSAGGGAVKISATKPQRSLGATHNHQRRETSAAILSHAVPLAR